MGGTWDRGANDAVAKTGPSLAVGEAAKLLERAMTDSYSVTIPLAWLKALALFADQHSSRYSLGGVCVETDKWGAYFVATDGRRIAAMFRAQKGLPTTDAGIIPVSLINRLKRDTGTVTVEMSGIADGKPGRVTIVLPGRGRPALSDSTIEGRFPKWRDVFPREFSGEPAMRDPRLLGDFSAALRLIHGDDDHIALVRSNGPDKAALVDIGCPEFCGIIMPMLRDADTRTPTLPPWVHRDVPVKAERTTKWRPKAKGKK
jgi:hypothetical protein